MAGRNYKYIYTNYFNKQVKTNSDIEILFCNSFGTIHHNIARNFVNWDKTQIPGKQSTPPSPRQSHSMTSTTVDLSPSLTSTESTNILV